MAELQRSSQTFRRSGSSGLVWDKNQRDHGVACDAGDSLEPKELRHSRSVGSIGMVQKPRGNNGQEQGRSNDGNQAFRARQVLPVLDPPSPKAAGCMFCGIFRKEESSQPSKSKPRRRY